MPDLPTPRPCVPEWCESGTAPHDDVCDNAPMVMTKHEFVEATEAAARLAFDAYFTASLRAACSHEEAIEQALGEVNEASTCYAGIGSCGRGWCHHA